MHPRPAQARHGIGLRARRGQPAQMRHFRGKLQNPLIVKLVHHQFMLTRAARRRETPYCPVRRVFNAHPHFGQCIARGIGGVEIAGRAGLGAPGYQFVNARNINTFHDQKQTKPRDRPATAPKCGRRPIVDPCRRACQRVLPARIARPWPWACSDHRTQPA